METAAPTNTIGLNIRKAREAKGLTQRELADAIGHKSDPHTKGDNVASSYISRLESGDHQPRLDTLAKIAKALGTTVPKLLTG